MFIALIIRCNPVKVLLIEDDELLFYYTTPQAKNQAGNAGNAKENTRFSADFLPGACRTGGRRHLVSALKMFKQSSKHGKKAT